MESKSSEISNATNPTVPLKNWRQKCTSRRSWLLLFRPNRSFGRKGREWAGGVVGQGCCWDDGGGEAGKEIDDDELIETDLKSLSVQVVV